MPIPTPSTVPAFRKKIESIQNEQPKKKKPKKKEFRLVYIKIETKESKTVGEAAKELEINFKGFSPARLIEPDETNLLLAVEKFLKNNPPRIYIVELTDGISRWFYVFPSVEKIKFEEKRAYRVFVVKKKDAVKEILRRIVSGEFSGRFKLDFLTLLQILIGFVPFIFAYMAGQNSLQDLFNYLLWAVAVISAIQGIKRGYKEKSWEE
ncbi:hypothetical protein [Thermococcus barophilus]|uniref:Uncharacterized protein n=1 Tax=Thermococcus barophilus (strain DSM 11836 / MP) TaxID=391623 RepID=F0LJ30_THEBM|nr:hypothetical protein [Thermococcus barophilus]ADT83376.1 hypothetical protein TERMP_00399 [Thermococcus barophilus MP]